MWEETSLILQALDNPFHRQGETFPNGPEKDALLHGLRSEQLILKTTQDSQKVFSYLDSDA